MYTKSTERLNDHKAKATRGPAALYTNTYIHITHKHTLTYNHTPAQHRHDPLVKRKSYVQGAQLEHITYDACAYLNTDRRILLFM